MSKKADYVLDLRFEFSEVEGATGPISINMVGSSQVLLNGKEAVYPDNVLEFMALSNNEAYLSAAGDLMAKAAIIEMLRYTAKIARDCGVKLDSRLEDLIDEGEYKPPSAKPTPTPVDSTTYGKVL